MSRKQFTDAQKAAYYKKKANANKNPYRSKSRYVTAKSNARLAERKDRRDATKDPGVISAIGGGAGGLIGEAFGPAGMAVGTMLGGKLGHLVEKITGFGDYKIVSNSIMKGGMSPPQVVNSFNKGGFIVRHREYISEVQAHTAFTIAGYPLNPGMAETFPWLAGIAQNFDQYRFRGILFEFKSTSSDAVLSSATSSALGSINMATDYDAVDAAYANKREMLNSLYANSTKPSCNLIHPVECKRAQTPMQLQYIRNGPFPPNTDARMYDLGNFYVATEGMQADGGILGELWVTYEVEFFKQQVPNLVVAPVNTDHWNMSGVTGSEMLGTTRVQAAGVTMVGTTDSGTYYFPDNISSGDFLLSYWNNGADGVTPIFGGNLLSNCTGGPIVSAPTSGAVGTVSGEFAVLTRVRITAAPASVSYLTSVIAGAPVTATLWVSEIDPNVVT